MPFNMHVQESEMDQTAACTGNVEKIITGDWAQESDRNCQFRKRCRVVYRHVVRLEGYSYAGGTSGIREIHSSRESGHARDVDGRADRRALDCIQRLVSQ